MSYNESLKSNSNYPKMSQSEWDNAPFNEVVLPERDFDIECEFVMRKYVTVTTNDYVPEYDDEDGRESADTENTDWGHAFANSGHFTIQDLIDELREYVKEDMKNCAPNTGKGAHLERLLEACNGWETVEANYTY